MVVVLDRISAGSFGRLAVTDQEVLAVTHKKSDRSPDLDVTFLPGFGQWFGGGPFQSIRTQTSTGSLRSFTILNF